MCTQVAGPLHTRARCSSFLWESRSSMWEQPGEQPLGSPDLSDNTHHPRVKNLSRNIAGSKTWGRGMKQKN